ncbi:MAG TPA: flagellar protein FlbB [Xanthobacteraceae bacterium]|nr:flagellar protein FlbB [Xanthobacteraceae bacterium]
MKRLIRDFRVLPVVVFAIACLLVLKLIGLAVDGGYVFDASNRFDTVNTGSVASRIETRPAVPPPQKSWAQEVLGYPETTGGGGGGPPAKPPDKPPQAANPPPGPPDGKVIPVDGTRQLSPGERAVLERLQDRRQELDARSREIEIRENLLKAAEKRLENRAADIKNAEGNSAAAIQKREEAEVAKVKSIVVMYENMKAKEAARIFDRLDMKVLIEVASGFNPRKLSEVLAQMQPEAAEKLTVELANRAHGRPAAAAELPKIEGRPAGQ